MSAQPEVFDQDAAAERHTYVFDLADGSQALVEVWEDGSLTIAFRPDHYGTWGPPAKGEEVT